MSITEERYEKLLERIARYSLPAQTVLLGRLVRNYGLDYQRTRNDLLHTNHRLAAAKSRKRKEERKHV